MDFYRSPPKVKPLLQIFLWIVMFRGPYVTPPTEIRGGEGHHSILKLLLLVTSARLQNYFSPWCERWVKKRMKLWWCSRETLNITRKQFIPCSEMKMEVSGFRKLTFQRKILATNIKLCNALHSYPKWEYKIKNVSEVWYIFLKSKLYDNSKNYFSKIFGLAPYQLTIISFERSILEKNVIM